MRNEKYEKKTGEKSPKKEMESGKTNKQLIVFAANANSIKNKTISLKFNIDVIKPHIVIIQETKLKRKSQIEIDG